jgi:hypothetical protein
MSPVRLRGGRGENERNQRRPPGRSDPENRSLTANTEALNQGLVPFRATALQVVQEAPAASDHRQQSTTGMMVLLVRLEMVRELQNSLAQDGYLYLWRPAIGFVLLELANNLLFNLGRQCHSRIDTPRLTLIFVSIPLQDTRRFLGAARGAGCGESVGWGRARWGRCGGVGGMKPGAVASWAVGPAG